MDLALLCVCLSKEIPIMYDEIKKSLYSCWPGVFGALLSLYYTKPLNLIKGVISFLGGAVAAISLAPAVAAHGGEHIVSGLSFVIGTFAMSILGILFQIFDRIKTAQISGISDIVDIVIDVLLAFRHGRTRGSKNDD